MNNSITECLSQIVELTKQNLNILKTLNSSFTTKKQHLSTTINGEQMIIPSFLSLESKIDTLQQNFDNIVNAPLTGEAYIHLDENSQRIELSSFATTPPSVDLQPTNVFGINNNLNIFKDFVTPSPYLRFDISNIPNNVKNVRIKKYVISNDTLCSRLTPNMQYSELQKILFVYEENTDYSCYETIQRMPLRCNNAFGRYTIKNIKDNYKDSNFEEHYSLELNEQLTYFINNGTLERSLNIGDELATNNGKVKMVITSINDGSKTIDVKILFGAYANLADEMSNNPDLYRLQFIKPMDFEKNKYIDVTLEEDRYVVIFIAPIYDTTNTVAPYGEGVFIDTDSLTYTDEKNNIKSFREYYDNYVNNIGDALYNITKMMDDDEQVERLTQTEFKTISEYVPKFDNDNIIVTQINKHLNDSESVKNIRKLYSQKIKLKEELKDIQSQITNINTKLSDVSFDDNNNIRSLYTSQLSELNSRQHEISQSLINISNDISRNANDSEIPIENAKYHIRGFVPLDSIKGSIIKIDVEYRYKNKNKFTGNAETISDSFVYSDWNTMVSEYNLRIPVFEDNIYKYKYKENNENKNEISFNQIDIPISQGECVDIRFRYVYNFGYPFVKTTSAWSDILTIDFPVEYLQNIEILDIISENNDDIKKYQFDNILETRGINKHISDHIQDQTITYFHNAANIASGFFTAERRNIPVSDKLREFTELITDLQSEVYGSDIRNLVVTISDNNNAITLKPNIINIFHNQDYSTNLQREEFDFDNSSMKKSFAYSQINLNLYNSGKYNIKLHTLFEGNNTQPLNIDDQTNSAFELSNYTMTSNSESGLGVWMQLDQTINNIGTQEFCTPQVYNQFLYFRVNDANQTKFKLYEQGVTLADKNDFDLKIRLPKNKLEATKQIILPYRSTPLQQPSSGAGNSFSVLFPYIGQLNALTIPADQSYQVIRPGESINIPLSFYYWFDDTNTTKNIRTSKAIEFDIRTSLFSEPFTYKLVVEANKTDIKAFTTKSNDEFSMLSLKQNGLTKYNTIISTKK